MTENTQANISFGCSLNFSSLLWKKVVNLVFIDASFPSFEKWRQHVPNRKIVSYKTNICRSNAILKTHTNEYKINNEYYMFDEYRVRFDHNNY